MQVGRHRIHTIQVYISEDENSYFWRKTVGLLLIIDHTFIVAKKNDESNSRALMMVLTVIS